jgi:hypothetical protein
MFFMRRFVSVLALAAILLPAFQQTARLGGVRYSSHLVKAISRRRHDGSTFLCGSDWSCRFHLHIALSHLAEQRSNFQDASLSHLSLNLKDGHQRERVPPTLSFYLSRARKSDESRRTGKQRSSAPASQRSACRGVVILSLPKIFTRSTICPPIARRPLSSSRRGPFHPADCYPCAASRIIS